MEDHDDWKLGDEGENGVCPRCGRRNHPGLDTCTTCGTRLSGDLETDPESLRTIGETMGRRRPSARGRGQQSLRGWTIAASVLVIVVAVLTWLETRETPFRLEDLLEPPEPTWAPVAAEPTAPLAEAMRPVHPTARPLPPTPRPLAPTARPLAPTARPLAPTARLLAPTARAIAPTARAIAPTVRPIAPTARPVPATPVHTAPPPPQPTAAPPPPPPPPPPVEPAPEGERILLVPPPVATEKPSLGTDLQDATRAYRRAVDVHNAAVDDYNALADEIQRRNAWNDDPEAVALRRRLDRAREAVESARAEAEVLRTKMEAVRSRYR